MKKIFFLQPDRKKWKQIADMAGNLLLFVVTYLISSVIFSIDNKLPEPNETAKFIKLVSLVPIISISGIILVLLKRNMRFSLLDFFSLLFLTYFLISVFVRGAGDPGHILIPIALAAIYILVRVGASGSGSKWIMLAILCVSIFEMILGLKQIYGYSASNHFQYSLTGSFFNPGPFGGYLAFIFALSLSILIKMRKKGEIFLHIIKRRKFRKLVSVDVPLYFISFAILVFSFILLPATMSRSAWMAVCVVSLMIVVEIGIFKSIKRWFLNRKHLLIPLMIAVIILVIVSIAGIYSLKRGSADSRLFSWQISTKIIAANPVTGVGVGYFGGAYAHQQSQYFVETPESESVYIADCPTYAFNEYLQIGSELGLVGLALFAIIIISAFWKFIKKPNPFHYGLIAILVFAFTSYPFHIVPLLIFVAVSIAAQGSMELSGNLTGRLLFAILSISTFAVWTCSRPLISDNIKALTEWKKLHMLYGMNIYKTDDYDECYSTLKYDHKFLFEYGHLLNKVSDHEKSNEVLFRGAKLSSDPMFYNVIGNNYLALKDYKNAEESYKMAYHIVPSRIYPLFLLAKLYVEQGDTVKAIELCRTVIEFKPKVHSPAVLEIKTEIKALIDSLEIKQSR